MSNRIALNILAVGCLVLGCILLFTALPEQDTFRTYMLITACVIIGSSLGLLLSDKSEA